MNEHTTHIPCLTCGQPTPNGSQRCNNCWEVERRLANYLKSPNGMKFACKHIPVLDDWVDQHPDAWDYSKVLADNDVYVGWEDKMTSDGVTFEQAPPDVCGWGLCWKHGTIHIGPTTETIARKAAALFVSLWLRGISASFCDKLMAGYIWYLKLQEDTSLTFLAEIGFAGPKNRRHFLLSREGLCDKNAFTFRSEETIIDALGPVAANEEIIVTFTKRKKSP